MSVINDADLKNKAEREYDNSKESFATTAILGISSGIFLTFGIFGFSGALDFLPIAGSSNAVPVFCVALAVASALGAVFCYSNTIDENKKIKENIFKKYKEVEDDRNREIEKKKRINRLIDIDNVKTLKQQSVLNLVKEVDPDLEGHFKNKRKEERKQKQVLIDVNQNLSTDNELDNINRIN